MKINHLVRFLLVALMVVLAFSLFACNETEVETEGTTGGIPTTDTSEPEDSECTHDAVVDAAVAPTCEATGLTEGSHCSKCGEVLTAQEEVPATGHNAVVDAAVAPTCEETGLTEGSHCGTCEKVLTAQEAVPATGHNAVVDAAVAPTCEEIGLTEGSHCGTCTKVLTAQTEIPATGHDAVVDAAVAPTCDSVGLSEGSHCGTCTTVLTAQTIVDALGHAYTSVVTKEATFYEKGEKTYTCANDESHNFTEAIPSLCVMHVNIGYANRQKLTEDAAHGDLFVFDENHPNYQAYVDNGYNATRDDKEIDGGYGYIYFNGWGAFNGKSTGIAYRVIGQDGTVLGANNETGGWYTNYSKETIESGKGWEWKVTTDAAIVNALNANLGEGNYEEAYVFKGNVSLNGIEGYDIGVTGDVEFAFIIEDEETGEVNYISIFLLTGVTKQN